MRLILLTGALLFIVACGQKGPLYLPVPDGSEPPPADTCRTCPPASAPAPSENSDSDADKNKSANTTNQNSTATPQESTQ